jgi:CheY-like chemotaxis protein
MILEGKRIFVVEDDARNLAIISVGLRRSGAVILFDTWGADTVNRLLWSLPVDIILLDLMLPGSVSGYDVFDRIRATPELADIPVVAVTAMDPGTEMNKARKKGFSGYISKPIRMRPFIESIETVLRGQQVWGVLD